MSNSDDYVDDQDSDWDDVDPDEQDDAQDDEPDAEALATTDQEPAVQAEPEVELDPEDPVEFPDQFYDVQEDYDHAGQTIEAGTSVQIKCGNCAAWEAPLTARGGKSLCRPGQQFGLPVKAGEEPKTWRMQEDRYSCQTQFIPKDMEDVLALLSSDADQVRMLLWAFPTIAKMVKLIDRIQKHHETAGGDAEISLNNVIDFVMLFRSEQQQQLVKPFVKMVHTQLAERKVKKPARRKNAFKAGDNVSWQMDNGRAEGFIQAIGGRGNLVTILVAGPSVQLLVPGSDQPAIRWKRSATEWRKMDPRVLATTPIVTDE